MQKSCRHSHICARLDLKLCQLILSGHLTSGKGGLVVETPKNTKVISRKCYKLFEILIRCLIPDEKNVRERKSTPRCLIYFEITKDD